MSPWRKHSKLIEVDPDNPIETRTLLESNALLTERSWALLRWITFITVIMFVTMIVMVMLVSKRNKTIDDTKVSADDARVAAVEAHQAVDNAIKLSQSGVHVDPAKINAALEAVHRLELHICGGECSEDADTTTTVGS